MASIVDTLYTYKFLKLLSTKWTDTKAYELGIIDENGEPLKDSDELETQDERNAYSMFNRLVFKLKRMMEKIPGGKSATARYAAAIYLIREEAEITGYPCNIDEKLLEKHIKEEVANVTGGVDKPEKPMGAMHRRLPKPNNIYRNPKDKKHSPDETDNTGYMNKKDKKFSPIKEDEYEIPAIFYKDIDYDDPDEDEWDDDCEEEGWDEIPDGEYDPEEWEEVPDGEESDDDWFEINGEDDPKEHHQEESYTYNIIDGRVLRTISEAGRAKRMKTRVIGGKRVRRRETATNGIYTRTGHRKLRGAKLVRKRRSLRKAIRHAHRSGAQSKRRRSVRKLRRLVHH